MFGSMVIGIGQTEDILIAKVFGRDKEDIVYGMKGNGNNAVMVGIGEKASGTDSLSWKFLLTRTEYTIAWSWRFEDPAHPWQE
jgi:hypothetical protein